MSNWLYLCMMISLIPHIEYLMMRHDCVVVPGWGALVANHAPAQLNESHIGKPSRLIGFNPSITHNDGLLATSLTRRHGLSYDKACELIATNVAGFGRQLSAGTEIAFGHIGYFKLDENGKMQFVPTLQYNACDEFFGLQQFEFATLSQAEAAEKFAPVSRSAFIRKAMKTAASIVALVGMGLLLSTPVIVDRQSQSASLNIATVKTKPTTITLKPAAATTASDNKIAVVDNNAGAQPVSSAIPAIDEPSAFNEGMPCDESGAYYLVINSCNKQHQAAALIKQYGSRGIKAKSIHRGKYYHLVVAQSNSKQELVKAKKLLPEKYRKAWVCK
ncbi:MAG: SPOR domain-containing protein [Muribaculaceae bacterium]|nr:SPOR domain-containing protein [Muribaculaceae bacterium]